MARPRVKFLLAGGAITPPDRPRRHRAHAGGIVVSALSAVAMLGVPALRHAVPRLVWNASASAPVGLYWVLPDQPIRRGDMVLATLPDASRQLAAERGYLPARVPLVKRVAATAGDTICAAGSDITIAGHVVAARLAADRQGRPLPAWSGCRTLTTNEVFLLMVGEPASFDGRYFGPVETSRIIGRLVPLWTR